MVLLRNRPTPFYGEVTTPDGSVEPSGLWTIRSALGISFLNTASLSWCKRAVEFSGSHHKRFSASERGLYQKKSWNHWYIYFLYISFFTRQLCPCAAVTLPTRINKSYLSCYTMSKRTGGNTQNIQSERTCSLHTDRTGLIQSCMLRL